MTVSAKPVVWGVGLLALGYGVWALLRPVAERVETAAPKWQPLQVTIDEEGETRVRDRFVVTAPVAGRVARISVREGDAVRAGAIVARMFPAPLDPRARDEAVARVAAAEDAERAAAAAVAQARAAHEQAHREWERARQLAGQNAIAVEARERIELEEASRRRDLESAEFRSRAAAHEVEAARAALSGATAIAIRAPVSGRILRVAEPSERVAAAGTPLLEIGDPARLEVTANLLSVDAVQVRPGTPLLLAGWGGDTLHGRVRRIEPSAFTKVSALGIEEQRVRVIGDVDDPPATLGDRYRVDLRIVLWSSDRALIVPASAVFRYRDGWRVFVVDRGRARARDVTLGHRTPRDAQILAGLTPDVLVIRYPSDRVRDGVRVTLLP